MNEKKLVPSQLHSRLRSKLHNWLHCWLLSKPIFGYIKRTFSRIPVHRLQLDDFYRTVQEEDS
jgi:hypothetical protein